MVYGLCSHNKRFVAIDMAGVPELQDACLEHRLGMKKINLLVCFSLHDIRSSIEALALEILKMLLYDFMICFMQHANKFFVE